MSKPLSRRSRDLFAGIPHIYSASPYEVKLDKAAKDSLTGESGTSFTIPSGDGRILIWDK
jgi:hypothetical protein